MEDILDQLNENFMLVNRLLFQRAYLRKHSSKENNEFSLLFLHYQSLHKSTVRNQNIKTTKSVRHHYPGTSSVVLQCSLSGGEIRKDENPRFVKTIFVISTRQIERSIFCKKKRRNLTTQKLSYDEIVFKSSDHMTFVVVS